jgi:hypothetical protein
MKSKEIEIISKLKDFDLVTFEGSCVSWSKALWKVSRATEKAILIDGEWLPKSQIVGLSMVEKKKYDGDNINFTIVRVPELIINKWFDEMNDKKRGFSNHAY